MPAVHDDHYCEDPVLAYDRLAGIYAELAEKRARYLAGVEREILARIAPGGATLLDVGAGDGNRALRIASRAGIRRIVLAEPSEKMLTRCAGGIEIWRLRAEELGNPPSSAKFDVITCLWNVLGHIKGAARRAQALSGIASLLYENGRFFTDVNHRYNARAYGVVATSARMGRDLLLPSGKNGDVQVHWNAGQERVSTYGHFFTNREIAQLAEGTGLKLEERIVIDYDNGNVRRSPFQGNLLYVFRRA
jgi:SAM-dependent methyltransferase